MDRTYEISGEGTAFRAVRREDIKPVFLKVIRGAMERSRSAQRTCREIAHLHRLAAHPNIAQLRDVHLLDEDVVLVFDWVEVHPVEEEEEEKVSLVAYQLFAAMAYMHSARIAHRDVRPSNLLIDARGRLRICDFGSAIHVSEASARFEDHHDSTDVGRLAYRPFDVLVGADYSGGCAGDVWAAGCVIVELATQEPLFAGDSELEVLAMQMGTLGGPPTPVEARELGNVSLVVLPDARPRPSILDILEKTSEDFAELVSLCLRYTPRRRCSAHAALAHSLFDRLRDDTPTTYHHHPGEQRYHLQCGDALDKGGNPWHPAAYRAKLQAYLKQGRTRQRKTTLMAHLSGESPKKPAPLVAQRQGHRRQKRQDCGAAGVP